jgi:hypothetical protein
MDLLPRLDNTTEKNCSANVCTCKLVEDVAR